MKSNMALKQIRLFILISFALCACNGQTENEETDKPNSDFEAYITTLDLIPLPLSANPVNELPELSKNFDHKGFEKYKHVWTSQPLGIYYKNDQSIGIIDCSIGDWGLVPFLTTYNLDGTKIDSTAFYIKSGRDMGYDAMEYLTFNENNTIVVLDTVKRWDIHTDESLINESDMKITTGRVEYQISANGKIEKI